MPVWKERSVMRRDSRSGSSIPRPLSSSSPLSPRDSEDRGSRIGGADRAISPMSPLAYLDQLLRDVTPPERTKLVDNLMKAVPNLPDRSLVEVTIPIGSAEEQPKCKASTLKIPRLVTILNGKRDEWRAHLHLVCTREDLKRYTPFPDESKTIKSFELAQENLSMLWCIKESVFYGSKVTLERKEELVCELMRLFSYHLLDAVDLVKTMYFCSKEAQVQDQVAKLLVEGGAILELKPTISSAIATRRIFEKRRIAVLSMFSLKPQKLQGENMASFLPVKYCIHALYVLEAIPTKKEGVAVVEIVKTTDKGIERYPAVHVASLLNGKELLYCDLVLYDTEDQAISALLDLNRYIENHGLRKTELEDVEL